MAGALSAHPEAGLGSAARPPTSSAQRSNWCRIILVSSEEVVQQFDYDNISGLLQLLLTVIML